MAINNYIRTSSLDIYESVSFKNLKQKDLYNRLLLGVASRAQVGQDAETNNLTARPPSWTQHAAGMSQGFVAGAISSSMHETQCLNARLSGSFGLESSPVPASGNLYFSKTERFVKVIYKVTGSALLPGNDGFNATSGALLPDSSAQSPFIIPFDVQERGRIVDIKVWVELINRSGSEPGQAVLGNLSTVGLALKSPNTRFESSVPIMNDKTITKTNVLSLAFFGNTYLLWVGSQLDDLLLTLPTTADDHHTWGLDRHMRVVFSDSAHPVDGNNPRNIASSHGGFFVSVTSSAATSNYAGNSPNGSRVQGNDWPWISDVRVQEGGNHGAAGSPPEGWLTGPGKTAANNEWPTTGSNYGPVMMKPMYPLLDTVLEEKSAESINREKSYNWTSGEFRDSKISTRKGIRPGLRGTQSQGIWELMILTKDIFSVMTTLKTYFRQARLELTIDKGEQIRHVLPRKKNINVSAGPVPIAIMSGAYAGADRPDINGFATNKFRNIVYMVPPEESNVTVGITDNTGSLTVSNFAIFTRITGALADRYSGSNMAHARYKFLNNEFGTPYIPLSSGSGVPMSSEVHERTENNSSEISAILNPSSRFSLNQTLLGIKSVTRPSRQTRELVAEITSGST